MQLDLAPYKAFMKLKEKYPAVPVLVTDKDMATPGLRIAFKSHRDFVGHMFREKGIEIYRWQTNYDSLQGNHPEIGVVWLANDSSIMPGVEAWALIGHNARYVTDGQKTGN